MFAGKAYKGATDAKYTTCKDMEKCKASEQVKNGKCERCSKGKYNDKRLDIKDGKIRNVQRFVSAAVPNMQLQILNVRTVQQEKCLRRTLRKRMQPRSIHL